MVFFKWKGDMIMAYLLNINARTVHNEELADGRCKLKLIKAENKMRFDDLESALTYLPKGKKPTKKCSFCCDNYEQD